MTHKVSSETLDHTQTLQTLAVDSIHSIWQTFAQLTT